MSDVDDIAIGLAKSLHQQHADLEKHIQSAIERALGRAVLKLGLGGILTAVVTVGGGLWHLRGTLEEYNRILRSRETEIADLQQKVKAIPQALDAAVEARKVADNTASKLDGHLRPDPQVRR